ncbi:MAG: DMT family transporter [Pseudomonadota bacterium]
MSGDTATRPAVEESLGLGIAAALLCFMFFSSMDALAKWLGATYAVAQLLFFRSLFGFLPVVVVAWREGGLRSLKTRRPGLHLLRGLFILGALGLYFQGLKHLHLAEALAIAFTAPLFMTALAGPILGEKVGTRRWGAVIVGFIGVLIMVRPEPEKLQLEALYVLGSAFCFALTSLTTRVLTRSEGTASIMFYSTLGIFIPSLIALPVDWITPDLPDLALFFAMGLLGGLGLLTLTTAYRNAPASVIAPLDYSSLIWAVLFGWIGWGVFPETSVWYGAVIVAAAGIYIAQREAAVKRRAEAAQAASG